MLVHSDSRLGAGWLPSELLESFGAWDPGRPRVPQPLDVERLLTYLSQDQPYLRPHENLSQRALFLRLATGLAEVIGEIETEASSVDPPEWLLRLVSRREHDHATVATFNYDTLVEKAFLSLLPTDRKSPRRHHTHRAIYGAPILPGDARRGFTWGEGGGEAFAYLKMHGSLNWYFSGAATYYGEPVYDRPVPQWGKPWPAPDLSTWVRKFLPDKVPLIIPPTTMKSDWFSNELVRGQWLMLGEALRSSDRLVCIGYSLPATDSMTHALLATTSTGREVLVVDRSTSCAPHYQRLLHAAKVNSEYTGDDAVERFVEDYCSTA
jgi:hypothetical protein